MKKVIIFLLALVIFGAAGFLGYRFFYKDKQAGKEITLTYWGLWEPEAVMQGVIAEWVKKNPNIKIDYRKQDKEDYRARLQSAFSRNEGPDIFRFHQTWMPMLKDELAPVPEPVTKQLGLTENYFTSVTDPIMVNGQYYGIPLMVDNLALYYNQDILAAANEQPPITWWGLEKLAQDLTVRIGENRISVAGAALGTTSNVDHWSDIIGLMIYQNGGDPGQPDKLVIDSMNYYLKFAHEINVWDETMPYSTLAFAQGKVAFYFGPSWRVFNIQEANPRLNYRITTVPQLPELPDADWEKAEQGEEELTNEHWATFWVEGVSLQSEHQEAAWKFLEYLSSKETMQKLFTAQGQIRDFGEIYPRKDLAAGLENRSQLKPFIDQADTAKTWYLASSTYDGGINEQMIKYYGDALNALSANAREEEVIETLNSGVQQVLQRYGVGILE